MDDKELIWEIMKVIKLPGEYYTDGECLDEVIKLIEEAGYNFDWEAFREENLKNKGRKVLPLSKKKDKYER